MTEEIAKPTGKLLIIDLGKQKSKRIKALRKGKGRLAARLQEALKEFEADGTITADARPVIIVEKKRKSKGFRLF
jgi:hypothetical protein